MKTFKSIKDKLDSRGVRYEEVRFTDTVISARTSDTSVDHNYDPNSSIKTLVISTNDGYKGVILRGSDRIDQPRLKAIVGKWRIVDSDTLEKKLEYMPGTICPLDFDFPMVIDKSTLDLEVWSMGAGSNNKGFNVTRDEVLRNLSTYQIEAIRQET